MLFFSLIITNRHAVDLKTVLLCALACNGYSIIIGHAAVFCVVVSCCFFLVNFKTCNHAIIPLY